MQGVGIWHGTNILCEYHGVTCTFFCLKFCLVHYLIILFGLLGYVCIEFVFIHRVRKIFVGC
ncbi:Uncharacterised protein [Vibrio cholerae]|nr:Uncharacterised protein [Vibrio cholerae]